MTDPLWTALLIAATVGTGLNGGLFFIFSNTISFLTFFGTALLCSGCSSGNWTRHPLPTLR